VEAGADESQEEPMSVAEASPDAKRFRAGDWVEVRPAEEILAAVDEHGRLDGLPFMPEMLQFCGRRFRVQSRAHKTCDTAIASGFRQMESAVHLKDIRCDGSSHGGCQAACLLFWKNAWLRPADGPAELPEETDAPEAAALLLRATTASDTEAGEPRFSCQATELRAATSALRWWDVRQYAQDLGSRNVGGGRFARGFLIILLNKFQAANRRFLPRVAPIKGGRRYPFVTGALRGRTPAESLNLQPGELVRVKSKEAIEQTLDQHNRNRGLLFDGVMSKYCGQTARVRARVTKIVNEDTGTMTHFKTEAIMLEGMVCTGDYMQFCPRNIYDYWREIWLERV
jgi:hypothetical protein